jgi:hypothetical protein
MQGYVLSVRPKSGEATIITETGHAFRVHDQVTTTKLSGGDIVRFRLETASDNSGVIDLEVIAPWPERFSTDQSALLREFCTDMGVCSTRA